MSEGWETQRASERIGGRLRLAGYRNESTITVHSCEKGDTYVDCSNLPKSVRRSIGTRLQYYHHSMSPLKVEPVPVSGFASGITWGPSNWQPVQAGLFIGCSSLIVTHASCKAAATTETLFVPSGLERDDGKASGCARMRKSFAYHASNSLRNYLKAGGFSGMAGNLHSYHW